MYEAFYGLTEKPFNLTPDPRFLYLSEKHREAFAHLLFGIKNRMGFVMISGEIGTGKTTICRSLLNQLDPDTEVAFIFNPYLSPDELLRKINEDFGISSQAETVKGLIDELNTYLLEHKSQGKNCVLVIDEAQDLTPSVLEQLRLLSNLETETEKLLQIVLIGQPELAKNLRLPELRQLNQRITARYHLRPLDNEETVQYVAFRLRIAGGRMKIRFTRSAVDLIHRFSGGTPRVINAVCDRALLIGYTTEVRDINKSIIKRAIREIRGERVEPKKPFPWKRFLPNPSMVFTAILILVLIRLIGPEQWFNGPSNAVTASVPNSEQEPLPIAPITPAALVPTNLPDPMPATVAPTQPKQPELMDWAAELDPVLARNAACSALLRAWNLAIVSDYPKDDSEAGFVRFAKTNGLTAEPLTPTIAQLVTINLPALIKVAINDRQLWLALLQADDDTFLVSSGGNTEPRRVSRKNLETHYQNQAIVFWIDPAPNAPVLKISSGGPDVIELQKTLQALGLYAGEPSGVYDERTLAVIAGIQAGTGLVVDGRYGKQTRMVLTGWRSSDSTPSLTPKNSSEAYLADNVTAATGMPHPKSTATAPKHDFSAPEFAAPLPDFGTILSSTPSNHLNTSNLEIEELAPLETSAAEQQP